MASIEILSGLAAGHLQELTGQQTVIGRRPDSDLVLPSETVSRRHAIIYQQGNVFYIEDLNSTNGTLINGQTVAGRRRLEDRDLIRIEDIVLRFLMRAPQAHGLESRADSGEHEEPVRQPTIFASLDVLESAQRASVQPEAKLRAMMEIIHNLHTELTIEEVLPKILDSLLTIFPQADRAYALMVEAGRHDLRLKAMRQRHEQSDKSLTMRPIVRTIARRAIDEDRAVLSGDAADDLRFQSSHSVLTAEIHSVLCAPLRGAEGEPLGAIQIDTRDPAHPFSQADLDVLASVVLLVRQAVAASRAHETQVRTARLAAIGQTVAGIAHESRNVLHALQLGLTVLKKGAQDRPEDLKLIRSMLQDQNELTRLLEEVRNYAAPIRLDLKRCDLLAVWRSAWTHLAPQREGRDAHLHEQVDGVDLQCMVDTFRLEQMFRNLLENTLAACHDPVHISIHCVPAELRGTDAVRISMEDNGPGLNEEQRQHAFEAFYTTRSEGTGLGLAIARRIVEAHGGHIDAARRSKPGAEFVIVVPRSAPQGKSVPSP